MGGAVVASPSAALVDQVSQLYPGRASIGPALDVFVTLLGLVRPAHPSLLYRVAVGDCDSHTCVSLYSNAQTLRCVHSVWLSCAGQGVEGWTALLKQRAQVFPYLKEKLQEFAAAHGERVLVTAKNPVRWYLRTHTLNVKVPAAAVHFIGSVLVSMTL